MPAERNDVGAHTTLTSPKLILGVVDTNKVFLRLKQKSYGADMHM